MTHNAAMIQNEQTPLMQQYYLIRAQYPDTLLFFQVGDFYELFFDDAIKAAEFLGIALTARGKNKGEPIPLCGVPVHARDHYLQKLIKGGFKVALCDQLEQPRPGTVVRRGVTQVFSPGTLTDTTLLDERSASYLLSFCAMGDSWGLLFGEFLTAQLFATVIPATSQKLLEYELIRFFPDEIIIPANKQEREFESHFKRLGYFTTVIDNKDELENRNQADQWINQQFSKNSIDCLESHESLRLAVYYFYAYMRKNQHGALSQFSAIHFYQPDDFLILDPSTQRNLELIKNAQDGGAKNTLFSIMDRAKTAMGSRMIKKWIQRPLVKKEAIIQRQDVVAQFSRAVAVTGELEQLLMHVGDIERVIGRIALRRGSLFDYLALSKALQLVPKFKKILLDNGNNLTLLRVITSHLSDFGALSLMLKKALHDDPSKEWIIKSGYDEKLDRLRQLVNNSNRNIIELEQAEQQATSIQSLKIRYNAVQGYYIEITKANFHLVPERYRRIQTLVGRERFITQELQKLAYEIDQARLNITTYETELFEKIKSYVEGYVSSLRKLAHALAHLDGLLSIARLAYDNGYVRPVLNENSSIIIKNGRHPVVEKTISCFFIPNDTRLDDNQSLLIITGPNMGGKSTYLRQVALLCVMTHIGSFIPADSADIALLDRIFTRLGASDNVAEGKSTFLVEMEETATICTQATSKSLVILDEVGRGTSTFDGLAIAQAVVEYLCARHVRCLFATHYHELTLLQEAISTIASYHAASKKTESGIIFLYKIICGIADGSFGIDVARLAQLPSTIINRAQQLVEQFENKDTSGTLVKGDGCEQKSGYTQLLVEYESLKAEFERLKKQDGISVKLAKIVDEIDFEALSPKRAFDLLWQLKDFNSL